MSKGRTGKAGRVRRRIADWLSGGADERAAPPPPTDTALAQREQVLSALLHATADLSNGRDTDQILQCICDSIVAASRHIKLVWAWYGDPETNTIVPQIYAGEAAGYARNLTIKRNALTLRGPAFRALLAEQADYMGVSRISLYGPWRSGAQEFGFQVAAAFPIRVPDASKRGILIFYADDSEYFHTIGLAPFQALARVAEAAITQAHLRRQLQHLAETDPLTGLPNRRFMDRELQRLRALESRHHCPFVLMLIDIDHFKSINDNFGHPVGDAVLIRLADILRAALRAEDLAARMGGDEFLIALPYATQADGEALAQRIRDAVAADGRIDWRVSIGVAPSDGPNDSLEQHLKATDVALYAAKAAGRPQRVAALSLA